MSQVVLGAYSPAGIWQSGTFTPLPGPPDASATAINIHGDAVGLRAGSGEMIGWFGGVERSFAAAVPGTGAVPANINDNGMVAVTTSQGGFIYNSATNLSSPTGLRRAEAINNNGVAAGNIQGPMFSAATSVGGVATPLPGVPGDSNALDINDIGAVCGNYGTSSGFRPFYWFGGSASLLPVFDGSNSTAAVALNHSGLIVGYELSAPTSGALAWENGQALRLQDYVQNAAGWRLDAATGVNDQGQIVGSGTLGGQSHIFLLTPVPSPTSLSACLAAMGLLTVRRRR